MLIRGIQGLWRVRHIRICYVWSSTEWAPVRECINPRQFPSFNHFTLDIKTILIGIDVTYQPHTFNSIDSQL